ncbi:hypothetical protein M9Y10_020233 [Tritrichomonas musculus]|uniref:Uncharacterized protein n=1 Tax=Tritrichomonas musculus TaxID=1915356 RepID=A0ABR2HHW6_9EUKA
MNNDDLSFLSDVRIDNEEENITNTGILICDENPKQFFLSKNKSTFIFFSFLLFSSLFFPSQLQSTDAVHNFDSKHYPNYTIFAEIKNLPKYSLHGFFVSFKLFDFKDYQYKPKHNNIINDIQINKLKKSFVINGNLSIKLANLEEKKSHIFDADFKHIFLVSYKLNLQYFCFITQSDEFIIFSDKFPKYNIFAMNLTVNAHHPRAEMLIIKFYYCSFIYEIFDLFIRLSIIICIINTTPHFFYTKAILAQAKAFFNKNQNFSIDNKLNIQQILTFVLRFVTILYILIPTFSGSISSISFFKIPHFSFILNLNAIIRDIFFSFSLFYIISILKMTEKEISMYPKYLLQGEQSVQKVTIDECYDDQYSILIKPFVLIVPILIFMIINDCEIDFSRSNQNSNNYYENLFDIQNNKFSVSPEGFFVFRPLDSFNYSHFFLFLIFAFYFISSIKALKKFLLKKNLKAKDNMFESIKNRYNNYKFISLPFVCLLFLSVLKNFVILTFFFSKSGKVEFNKEKVPPVFNSSLQSEPVKQIMNFTSTSIENDERGSDSYLKNFFLLSLVNLFSFGERNALMQTLCIILPSLFTIFMSIMHTPYKIIMD